MFNNEKNVTSEEFYQALINSVNLGITLIGSGHKIVLANSAIGKMFNRDTKEFIGKYCFAEYEKRDAICGHCPGVKAMADGKTHVVETAGVRADGTHFFVQNHAVPILDKDSKPKGFIEIVEDITERKKAEEGLKIRTEELAAMNEEIKAANEELESTNEELRQANEELEATTEELRTANEEAQKAKEAAEKKVEQLERFNKVMVGRELEMKKLRDRIEEMEEKLKEKK